MNLNELCVRLDELETRIRLLEARPIPAGRKKRGIQESDGPTEKHTRLALTLGIAIGPEWGKFKNYCLAHDKRYANFEAAFRNWLVTAKDMKDIRR